jgi:hypothetical protein
MIAPRIELDRLSGDEEKGSVSLVLAWNALGLISGVDGLSQSIERLAQTLASLVTRLFGPQQARYGISTMRTMGFDAQIGKQSLRFHGGEVGDRLTVQGRSERPY